MVLGAMQRVKVPDKVMNYIMLCCSSCKYYPHFVEYPHFVDIICILWIYFHFVDIIRIGHIASYLARNIQYHIFET